MNSAAAHFRLIALMACLLQVTTSTAAPPASPRDAVSVARQIDRLIDEQLAEKDISASPRATDAEFLRRVFLDMAGRIPSENEAREFLDSRDSDKRAELIERLLASPRYGQRFGTEWHNLFVGRETSMARPPDTRLLSAWLTKAFNENRPWNELVTQILTAKGSYAKNPAGIFFTLNGDSRGIPQPNVITGTVSQLFLGVQLQCAECHGHPYSHWSQTDFWKIAAFFGQVSQSSNKGGAKREIKETPLKPNQRAVIKIPESSFTNVGREIEAALPGDGRDSHNADARNADAKLGPRETFAAWLTSADNPYFALTIVNRLWAQFFGRGLVDPLNGFREDNEPSHPELLELLSREFVASGFDQKHLIRCLCNSPAYQRTSQALPKNRNDSTGLSHMNIKVLSAEALLDSLAIAFGREMLSAERPKMNFRNPLLPLYSPREKFIRLFQTNRKFSDATEYTRGVPQLLFLMNQPQFNAGAPFVKQLAADGNNPLQNIDRLYLATLSRRPSEQERDASIRFVKQQPTPREGYDGVLWTLINRSEFNVNH